MSGEVFHSMKETVKETDRGGEIPQHQESPQGHHVIPPVCWGSNLGCMRGKACTLPIELYLLPLHLFLN